MPSKSAPWLMLLSRSALFILTQLVFLLVYLAAGNPNAMQQSARWWPWYPIVANLACLALLTRLFRSEGKNFWNIMKLRRETWKKDLLWLVGSGVIGLPLAFIPMNLLGPWLYGDYMTATRVLFQPLPNWAVVVAFLFPLTIWFAELPTYFGYAMPRLAEQMKSPWAAWLICSFFLALQHAFLPFLPDPRFWLYRAVMYLPFALYAGLLVKFRPQLLPYFAIVHALMDISAVSVYWMI